MDIINFLCNSYRFILYYNCFGKSITPVFTPIGIKQENWPATVGLMTGVLAKEVVLGSLNTLYSQEEAHTTSYHNQKFNLWKELKESWTSTKDNFKNMSISSFINPFTANEADAHMDKGPIGLMVIGFGSVGAAFAYMLFVLLYIPCIATMGAAAREAGKGWAVLSTLWNLALAYCLAVVAYQFTRLGTDLTGAISWITGAVLFILSFVLILKIFSTKAVSKEVNLKSIFTFR